MRRTVDATAHFQPIVDLRSSRVVGFEALARFDDGVSPLEHLRAAEEVGQREDLELRLIEMAVEAASALPVSSFVTLNASGGTMTDPFLAEVLQRAERSWGLELFEGSAPSECVAVREQVDRLGGFLLIDDAGTDFSDEDRIRQLRPDIVKIDGDLFRRSFDDTPACELIRGVVAAAHEVDARILVEGVEDAHQLETIVARGAGLAQGYHLGRPAPIEGVPAMLADLQLRLGMDADL
ncbi:EAL domain-containing protein [Microbacterium sp.]|uniref:EAL domain-containing protein n=1 Tax=Microbacterium sp. TaxID=51671 RepID=UPI00260665C3|nr:EAL domain-containing protein [uncultured Microbacterium sp.]